MNSSERRRWLLDRVADTGFVAVDEAMKATTSSASTIRRDINALAADGVVQRVHGGAIRADGSTEVPQGLREATEVEAKRAIAAVAARRLAGVATVGLTGGSTTTAVARNLPPGIRRVVTNSLAVASVVLSSHAAELVVTGGRARAASLELVGDLSIRAMESINLDVAIIGADGVDATRGVTTHDDVEAATNRSMMKRADRVILVADGTKIGRTSFARICGVDEIDLLITSASLDDIAGSQLSGSGLDVVRASGERPA
ncbi:MAG: DeoR/GlpR family DNA-binding transcription regulator [Actinomycetota bacterium]